MFFPRNLGTAYIRVSPGNQEGTLEGAGKIAWERPQGIQFAVSDCMKPQTQTMVSERNHRKIDCITIPRQTFVMAKTTKIGRDVRKDKELSTIVLSCVHELFIAA